ncbi:hypothetical protein P3T36_007876 [Kitasatospora sp. MAP12-15]|uniref:hypothetical protein n=1 Tax=unclassified Kitasatospora TaxID=2633591 RepID=UPI0024730171|nr:hypothetical protein [Kitasatospora sp. MAP12-44]MDH6115550.1 hypothetical protein [Kitasatospora sp. MAP12-44]
MNLLITGKAMKRTAFISIVAVAAAATLAGMTGSAYAAGPGGSEACPSNSICLYYNSPGYNWGSFEHWSPGDYPDLSKFTFSNWGNGSGYGVNVAGNAASLVNNTDKYVGIANFTYNNTGPGTTVHWLGPGYSDALPADVRNADWQLLS